MEGQLARTPDASRWQFGGAGREFGSAAFPQTCQLGRRPRQAAWTAV